MVLSRRDGWSIQCFWLTKSPISCQKTRTQAALATKQPLFTSGLLDSIDQNIIVLLSDGLQVSSIANQLNLSEQTIKKRKSKIKVALGLEHGNNEDILRTCRKMGLL